MKGILMGPYSETKQQHRINNIKSILANKKLPDDTRNLWEQKLHNIAVNEDEYNKRVFEIFKDVKQGIFTDVT